MALPSPSPFSLPLLSLTNLTRQQRGIYVCRAAARLGAHAVRPSSFGRGPPKNTYGGLFHTPRLKYIRRSTLPSLSHNPTTLRSPKSNYGQLNPKGPSWGVLLHPQILGPWASDPKSKKIGGCNFGKHPFWARRGHLPFFAVLDS